MPLRTHLERAALNEDDRVEETVADINDRHVERVRAELRLQTNNVERSRVTLCHTLVRCTLYYLTSGASPPRRRAAHRRLPGLKPSRNAAARSLRACRCIDR